MKKNWFLSPSLFCAGLLGGASLACQAEAPYQLGAPTPLPQTSQVFTPQASGPPFNFSREDIEAAANRCHEEVVQLWQTRSSIPVFKLKVFDLSIGHAQETCRRIVEMAKALRMSDDHMYTFQQSLKQAQDCREGVEMAPPGHES